MKYIILTLAITSLGICAYLFFVEKNLFWGSLFLIISAGLNVAYAMLSTVNKFPEEIGENNNDSNEETNETGD